MKIEQRQKVWNAVSEFYLDTELQATDYERIVEILKETDYSFDEIKTIDLYEAFPVLQPNLLMVAGVWEGFDEKWINEKCILNYKRRSNAVFKILVRFFNLFFYWMRRSHFKKIEELFKEVKL